MDAQKKQDIQMIPDTEERKYLFGLFSVTGPPQFKDADYSMITRAWFKPDDPSKETIKTLCKELGMDGLSRFRSNNLGNWMIHFGKKLVRRAMVNVKKAHNLQISDVAKIE